MEVVYKRVNAFSETTGFTCTCSGDKYSLVYTPADGGKKFISGSVDRCVIDGGTYVQFNGEDKDGNKYRHTSKKITDDFTLSDNGVLDEGGRKFTITIKGVDPFLP